jgi:hypothetical protein
VIPSGLFVVPTRLSKAESAGEDAAASRHSASLSDEMRQLRLALRDLLQAIMLVVDDGGGGYPRDGDRAAGRDDPATSKNLRRGSRTS